MLNFENVSLPVSYILVLSAGYTVANSEEGKLNKCEKLSDKHQSLAGNARHKPQNKTKIHVCVTFPVRPSFLHLSQDMGFKYCPISLFHKYLICSMCTLRLVGPFLKKICPGPRTVKPFALSAGKVRRAVSTLDGRKSR